MATAGPADQMPPPGGRGRRAVPAGVLWAALACAWVALLLTVNASWIRRHVLPYPPPWDQAFYLYLALRFRHALADHGATGVATDLLDVESYAAPLVPLTALPLHVVLGEGRQVLHLATGAYLLPMLVGTGLLARRLAGTSGAALAAFLISTFPMVIVLSRDLLTDLPAAAWLPLAVHFLIGSQGFSRRRESLAFGALAGVAFLTKTMTPVFLVAPAAIALLRSPVPRGRAVGHAALALAVAAAVSGWWWLPRLPDVLWYMSHFGLGTGADPYDPTGHRFLSARNLLYYGLAVVNDGLAPLLALPLALLAVARAARLRAPSDAARQAEAILLAWLVAGYAVLTVARNKAGDRYPVALLPAVAVLAAGWTRWIGPAPWRRGVTAGLLGAGLVSYLAFTLPSASVPWQLHGRFRPPLRLVPAPPAEHRWWRSPHPLPPSARWPIDDVLADLDAWWLEARLVSLEADQVKPLFPPEPGGPEAEVAGLYRRLLRREPDQEAQAYTEALRSGRLDLTAVARHLVASHEFRTRPARILVIADHPFFNVSALRYAAERERRQLLFVDAGSPPRRGDWSLHDAVVVRTGGPAPRRIPGADEEAAALEAAGSGFVPLPGDRHGPDGSSARVFVARPPVG